MAATAHLRGSFMSQCKGSVDIVAFCQHAELRLCAGVMGADQNIRADSHASERLTDLADDYFRLMNMVDKLLAVMLMSLYNGLSFMKLPNIPE